MKLLIVIVLIIIFCFFCGHAYKLRTIHNIEMAEAQIYKLHQDMKILTYALSLLPKEGKNEVFFNSIEQKFPYFKDDPKLCKVLGYLKTKEEREKDEAEEEIEKERVREEKKKDGSDTTVVKVMNSILDW